MSHLARRALITVAAMSAVTATTVTGTAQAVDGDQWTCHHASSASPNDKGGRDSYVTHVNPDNGQRAGMNFTASSEKVLQWNDSKDNVDFYANFYSGNRIVLTWHWNMEGHEKDLTHDFDRPEGQKVQLEVTHWQPSKGGCMDKGGVT
ncbi:hypothetical protein AB0I69_46980 [Streptomyces sp. NPDC050508]|jgi:hypothetical protein|uniref:hypothetical protein n=1 Tax=Streptomyces sp. NPDC050508 TaxID=3155405 RepID=UPI003422DE97